MCAGFAPPTGGITQDLTNLSLKLAEHKYEAEVELTLFQGDAAKTVLEKKHMSISTWKNKMYFKAGDMEFIANEHVQVTINHKAKVILINKNNLDKTSQIVKQMIPVIFDSLLEQKANLKELSVNGELHTIRITHSIEQSKVSYVDFTYSDQTYSPSQYIIQYKYPLEEVFGQQSNTNTSSGELPQLKLEYKVFKYLNEPSKVRFDISKYCLKQEDGSYKKNAAFQQYELLDYSTKKLK
jgi:hypothetical protein